MQYTRLGRANVKVSRICLGAMHFGSSASAEDSLKILDRAFEIGINFIDTANVYGGHGNHGRSEEIIGDWFTSRAGMRDQAVLATKVFGNMIDVDTPNEERGISSYKVRRQASDSLRRLQTDHIDLYQVHHIDRTISGEEFWGTFGKLIADGDVLYTGTSNFPAWGLAKFQMQAWQRGMTGLVSEQTQYNLLSRVPELEVLPAGQEFGIGILAYMPLAGGILTGKIKSVEGSRTRSVENEYGIHVGEANQQLIDFSSLCRGIGEKEHVVATAWVLAQPGVTAAIVGIRTVEQLEGLDRASELVLAPEIIARLNAIFDINRGRPLRPGPAPEAYSW